MTAARRCGGKEQRAAVVSAAALRGTCRPTAPTYGSLVARRSMSRASETADALAPLADALNINLIGHVTSAPDTHSAAALSPLRSPMHYLWPDADEAGETQMARTADGLRNLLRDAQDRPLTQTKDAVRRIAWEQAPAKGDAADWVARGGTVEDLRQLLEDAQPWSAGSKVASLQTKPTVALTARLITRRLSDVVAQDVDWLWHRWLAIGKFHLFAGHPGDGKSRLPPASRRSVLGVGPGPMARPLPSSGRSSCSVKSSSPTRCVPRLDLFDADATQIHAVEMVLDERDAERFFDVAKHLDLLEAKVVELDITLLVIDPLSTSLVGSDRNAEGDMRDRLTPLVKLAERRTLAVLGIGHVGKPTGTNRTPLQRILGSTGLGALARLVWIPRKPTSAWRSDP